MFEAFMERIEDAVDDPEALVRLRGEVEAAQVTDSERERLLGLIDRYEQDAQLDAEAAETSSILDEEGLGDAGA